MRVVSAIVLAPVVLACVWLGGLWFSALAMAAAAGLAAEWTRLSGWGDREPASLALMATCIVTTGLAAVGWGWAMIVAFLLGIVSVAVILGPGAERRRHHDALLGLGYIGLGMAGLAWLRSDPVAGLSNTLFLVLLIWSSDIGAYVVGRVIGGPRLAPAISPGKTWSGAVGGLLIAVGVPLVACLALQPPVSVTRGILFATVLGVVAQAGDLFESVIKRRAGVKDSGHLIPGHGGLLDRLDALLAAAPVAALLALASGQGEVLWK